MPLDLKKLEALTKLEPNNPKHWFYLGVYYISVKDVAQAYKALETAIKINPYFSQAQFLIGFIVIYNREFKTGLKYLEKAYTISEKVFLKIKSDREVEKILDDLINGSIKVIQDQIELNPNNLENLYVMGRILFYVQKFESAVNYFRKIIEIKPDNWEVYIYLALSYKELNNYESAINYLKKSILINSYYADSYWLLGEIYIDLGNYGLALKNLEKAVELEPNNSRYLNSLAKVYLELDRIPQAIRTLQISIDTNPNSKWSYFYLGKALEKEFQFELAIEQYLKSIEIDPNFTEAKISVAKLYSYLNDYNKAIEILENIVDKLIDPEIYFMLGQFYYNIKNYEKSINNLESYIKIITNNWQAFYLLYLDYVAISNKEKALFYLEKTYELNPKDTKIIVDLFKIYVDTRDLSKAEGFLDSIKNLVKDTEIIKRVIFIYFEKKDYENAFSIFFENKLYNDINYLIDLLNFVKNKDKEIYLSFLSKVLNFIDYNQNQEVYLKLQIEYVDNIYEINTLQAYEYFNSKIGPEFLNDLAKITDYQEIFNNKFYLIYIDLLLVYLKIIFTLFAEYKDDEYLRRYLYIVEKVKSFNFWFIKEGNNLNVNNKLILFILSSVINKDNLKGIILFYILIINFDFIMYVYNFRDYILRNKDFINFRNSIVIKAFEDLIPILIEYEIIDVAIDFIELFSNLNYPIFLKYKIDILDLENKSYQVLEEIKKYYSQFSYDSYIELIRLKNLINLGELKEVVKEDLEKLVLEFNPLAMALYANIIVFENKSEAFKFLDKAFEIIIEDKFKFTYNYQIISTVIYLSKIYSKYYSIYKLIKYLNDLARKFSNNYRINYLLAYYLYLVEEFVDAEIIAKKIIKLAKTNNLLIEAQKLLATIKTERENYNNFLLTLESNFKGIISIITSYLNLIKKGKIEEVIKYLESIQDDTKIENVIIKAILYDKLEIYQHFIYYYNLFKIWALDNNLDTLVDIIDKKLYNYSELSDFEELKLKAQINYNSLFKPEIQTRLTKQEQAIEVKLSQKNIDQIQQETEEKIELNQLDQKLNQEKIDNIQIDNIELNFDSLQESLEVLEPKKLDEKLDEKLTEEQHLNKTQEVDKQMIIEKEIQLRESIELNQDQMVDEIKEIAKPRESDENFKSKESIEIYLKDNTQENTTQQNITQENAIQEKNIQEIEKQVEIKEKIELEDKQELIETIETINKDYQEEDISEKSVSDLFESENVNLETLSFYLSNLDKTKLKSLDDVIMINTFYIIYLLKLQNKLDVEEIVDKISFDLFLEERDNFIKQNPSLKEFFDSIKEIEINIFDIKIVLIKLKEFMIKFKANTYYFSFLLFILSLVYLNLNKIGDYNKYSKVILDNFESINKNMYNFFSFINSIVVNFISKYVN
jgi:tetratricopeptide (TPR) repeat protein